MVSNVFLTQMHCRCRVTFVRSWWTERLQKRLADWYRRRAILRELIFEAERSDDEGDLLLPGGGGVEDRRQQQLLLEEQAAVVVGAEAIAAANGERGLPAQQQQQQQQEGSAGAGVSSSEAAAEAREGAGDAMDVEEAVASTGTTEAKPAGVGGSNAEATKANGGVAAPEKSQEWSGGGVEESKGGEGPAHQKAAAAATATATGAATTTEAGTAAKGLGAEPQGETEVSKVRSVVYLPCLAHCSCVAPHEKHRKRCNITPPPWTNFIKVFKL